MDTLSNFDSVFFARRASAPLYISTGLMDVTCPPSTVYAAFNNYATSDKRIQVWPFNGHEGGGMIDWLNAVSHVRSHVE